MSVVYGGHDGVSEEPGFLLHVVAFPQRQAVKLLYLHPKEVSKRLWSQIALWRKAEII